MEGHFRIFSLVVLLLILAPGIAFADVGDLGVDVGDMGMDMGDMATSDMAASDMAASDMAASDMATSDMATSDMATSDMATSDMSDMASSVDQGLDATTDASIDPDIPITLVTFTGTVRLRPDDIGSVSILLIGETGQRFQQEVFSGETFVFEEIPSGTYEVRVSSIGYETYEETIVLNSNAGRDFVLFLPASALLFVDITVDGEFSGDEEVLITGTSARGEFTETVPINDGMGEFTRELGVETWQVEFSAEGFQSVTQTVDITTSRESTSLSVRLYQNEAADVRVNEGCSCNVAGTSRTPVVLAVLGLVLGLGLWRRRRDQEI